MLGEHLNEEQWGTGTEEKSPQSVDAKPLPRTPNRKNGRIPIAAQIQVQPANSSQRSDWKIEGTCRDISEKGIGTLLDRPPIVGDFYWVEIESDLLKFQHGICRCIRCQFLREDKFEAGFEFLSETAPQFQDLTGADSDLI